VKNREKSFFQHSGMPLKVAPNIGRARSVAAPWLETFATRPAGGVAENSASVRTGGIPGSFANDEEDSLIVGQQDVAASGFRNLSSNDSNAEKRTLPVPSMLGREADGSLPMRPLQSAHVADRGAQRSSTPDVVAQRDPVSLEQGAVGAFAKAMKRDQEPMSSAGSQEQLAVRVPGTEQKAPRDREPTPQVVVKKTIEITTHSSMESIPEFRRPQPVRSTRHYSERKPGRSLASQVVETSVMHEQFKPASRGTEESAALRSSFTADAGSLGAPLILTEFLSMNGPAEPRWPQSSSTPVVGQSELLQRLNQQSSREPQQASRKRVHIGSVNITVMRPPTPSAAQPVLSQSPPPSSPAMTSSQVFMNPWDRMYTVFD
jgi:hypothetical protein